MGSRTLDLGWLVLPLFSQGGRLRHRSQSDCLSALLPVPLLASSPWAAGSGHIWVLIVQRLLQGLPWQQDCSCSLERSWGRLRGCRWGPSGASRGSAVPAAGALPPNLVVAGDSSSPSPGAGSHKLFPSSHSYYNAAPFVVL